MRDDFSQVIKSKLAERAGHKCSNSDCGAPTSGPQLTEEKSINVGVAAHISAAAPGGPRYDASLSPKERQHIRNGIWLCQICAKLVDSDLVKYTVDVLMNWKLSAEAEASARIGRPKPKASSLVAAERRVKHALKMRNQMRRDFLKPSDGHSSGPLRHPYDRFQYSEALFHDVERAEGYLATEDKPGAISAWFKHELFDFYNDGLRVILRVSRGFLNDDGRWRIHKYGEPLEEAGFREAHILELGNIPFRNIRHYDLHGDNHYNMPHIYCSFSDGGTPYEGYSFATAQGGSYEYLLKNENEITSFSEA